MSDALDIEGEDLAWGDRRATVHDVHSFVERYGRWSGRAWLEIRGPAWEIPITSAYGGFRSRLREAVPDRPWSSDWSNGVFPSAPWGLPVDPVTVVAAVAVIVGVISVGAALGPLEAFGLAVIAAWPLARVRDQIHVHRLGLRIGPVWSARVPWHDVREMGVEHRGRQVWVWARTHRGVRSGSVPSVLVPALRARLWRLGGVELQPRDRGLDERYGQWRAVATGAPWGLLVGTSLAAWLTPQPWEVLTLGLAVTAAVVLWGAAVEARATGWGTGAVILLTALYGLILVSLSVGSAGWVELMP